MTLAASGTLYLGPSTDGGTTRNIRYEILGAYGSYNIVAASTAAGFTLPTGMTSDFYGFSSVSPPNAPSSLVVAYDSLNNEMDLSWTDNSSDETSFEIYREVANSGTFNWVASNPANNTTWTDLFVLCSGVKQRYDYKVTAKNAGGESAFSNETGSFSFCP